ncbi:hypothetical protein MR730_03925 [bacterium]|nr:hypothetical protein [bacterium]
MGKAVARLIGFCPVCVSWQKRSVTAPFGHRLSDELSEIILDYLHFDHRLTTTVQWHYKMLEKPVVTTNNGLFPVLAANVQNQQNSRFNASLYCPVVVLRQLWHGSKAADFNSIIRCYFACRRHFSGGLTTN